ncbi:MAG TPA: A24 family peptidase [Tepidisphaeraceae bacterium]|jgi:prepilin peptidase CpaA|nr:A24 family peptidase [Tepidisphaeraceae bacterium]
MTWHALVVFAPLVVMLALAAAIDIRSRRIPNALTGLLALTGLMQSFTAGHTVLPLQSFLGLLTGAGLLLALFAIGAVGGGDLKLLAGAGAWLGPRLVFQVFLVEAVLGMVIVLVSCAIRGRLRLLMNNSMLLATNIAHVNQLGTEHVQETGASCRSVDRPLAYAVPIFIATIIILSFGRGGL